MFTLQVVWKGTTKVGVALAHKRRSDGMIESFIVARYFPPGNIRGYFTKNVGESGDKVGTAEDLVLYVAVI